jgi:tight adherence protein B
MLVRMRGQLWAMGVLMALAALSWAQPASAAAQPVSIAGIEVKNNSLVGLITASGGATIDTALTVTISGKDYPVDAITSGQGTPVARSAIIVVDTSGSMGAPGMATVRSSVAAFLKSVPDDVHVGVIAFSGTARLIVAPTTDRGKVQTAVDSLAATGETALYDAVQLAVRSLGATGERSILLISDGGDTASKTSNQAAATASLKAAKVRAEAVSFNSGESNTAVLKGFAAAGGGSVISAANSGAVQSAFTSAAKTLASQLTFSVPLPPGVSAVQNVKIAGTSNGGPFTTTALVDFGAGVPVASNHPTPVSKAPIVGPLDETVRAAAAPATLPGLGVPLWLGLAMLAVFLGVVTLGLVLAGPTFKSGRRTRVEEIERYVAPGTGRAAKGTSKTTAISESLVFLGERMMQDRESTSKTMGLIEKADLPLRAGEWWVLRIVSLVAAPAVVMAFLRGGALMTLVAAVLGLVVGFFLPALVLKFLAGRRGKKFDGQLPDVLTLVASSLSTGFSLPQALDAVAKDSPEPSAKEFSRALAETRIGADVSDSLERMAARMDSDNMRWTSMAIRIQREVGGNLAETMRTTAKTLREREELRRHVKALSAEGRLSAYILVALPIGIFLYTMQTNRSYIELLWTRPMGLAMMAGGIVSLGIGMFWMRKVVDVEV